jgi:hypothetical protein
MIPRRHKRASPSSSGTGLALGLSASRCLAYTNRTGGPERVRRTRTFVAGCGSASPCCGSARSDPSLVHLLRDVPPTAQIRSQLNCKENDGSAFALYIKTSLSPSSRKRSRYRTCLGRNLVYSLCRCSECLWRFVTSTTVQSHAVPCALLPIFATERLSSLQGCQRQTVAQRRRFVASTLRPHSLVILRRHKCASPSSSGTGLALGLSASRCLAYTNRTGGPERVRRTRTFGSASSCGGFARSDPSLVHLPITGMSCRRRRFGRSFDATNAQVRLQAAQVLPLVFLL